MVCVRRTKMTSRLIRHVFFALTLGSATGADAQPAPVDNSQPTLVIICTKSAGAPTLAPQANGDLAKALKRFANVVPAPKLRQTARRLKIKPADMGLSYFTRQL